jgi:predicted ATPase/transcriptional regulator with XRE-family HTH domain
MEYPFGAWLKRRRRVLDLTQDDLAARAYCSVNSIRKIESGDLTPSKALAQEIARALAIPDAQQAEFIRFARTADATAAENAFSDAPGVEAAEPAPLASGLPTKFQPPAALTALIGRERDVNVIRHTLRLPAARLVTLTGAPGTGKTRLALQVASELAEEYEHGAAFVALAAVSHGALLERALAEALAVRPSGSETLSSALRAFLRPKQLLLVLDSFEHVLDSAALAGELLSHAPRLKILTTSREPLRIYGERELPIAPLALPPLTPLPPPEALKRVAAVQLFSERAQQVKPDFVLTRANAEAVARICVALDGLPLAIEMAAARVKWETPQIVLEQLHKHVQSLGGGRQLDPRQESWRSAMDWSYDLLDVAEQRVLRQFGVFRGGFTLDAADALCLCDTRPVMERLVEKSLVRHEGGAQRNARYSLLEMVREYALEKLNAHGESEAASERHWAFYTTLTKHVGTDLLQPESAEALARVRLEQDNVRAALDWAVSTGRADKALELVGALVPFWYHTSAINEGAAWIDRVLPMKVQLNQELAFTRARVRDGYAEFLRMTGEGRSARALTEEAIADWRRAGAAARPYLGFALLGFSRLALYQGDDEAARASAQEALAIYTELQDPVGQARAWRRLAEWALHDMDYAYAMECIDHAIAFADATANTFERGIDYLQRGDIARARGKYDLAEQDYKSARRENETMPDVFLQARLTRGMGALAALRGEVAQSEMLLRQATRLAFEIKSRSAVAYCFASLALHAALQKQTARAMRWLGAMDAALEAVQMVLVVPELLEYEQTMELVNQQAPRERLQKWYAEGNVMSAEQAAAEWLQE